MPGNKKFISAEPADKIIFPAAFFENISDYGERLVAGKVTVLVVDTFKVVNIDHRHKKKIRRLVQVLHFPDKLGIHAPAVKKSGELVVRQEFILEVDKQNEQRDGHADPYDGKTVEHHLKNIAENCRNGKQQ